MQLEEALKGRKAQETCREPLTIANTQKHVGFLRAKAIYAKTFWSRAKQTTLKDTPTFQTTIADLLPSGSSKLLFRRLVCGASICLLSCLGRLAHLKFLVLTFVEDETHLILARYLRHENFLRNLLVWLSLAEFASLFVSVFGSGWAAWIFMSQIWHYICHLSRNLEWNTRSFCIHCQSHANDQASDSLRATLVQICLFTCNFWPPRPKSGRPNELASLLLMMKFIMIKRASERQTCVIVCGTLRFGLSAQKALACQAFKYQMLP